MYAERDGTITAVAANAVLAADGTSVRLPAGTKVAIRSGLPQPNFYSDDFFARYNPDPNVVKVSGAYDLPFGKARTFKMGGSRIADTLFGGWQIAPSMVIQNGERADLPLLRQPLRLPPPLRRRRKLKS